MAKQERTRAALVTGASSGIGLAITRMLVEEGHAVTMVARRPEKLQAAAGELAAAGAEVLPVPANVAVEEQVLAAVAAHKERFGRMDVLVNSAGVGIGQNLDQITTKYLDLQLDVNLRATVLFYRESLPLLRKAAAEHRRALVVNLSSVTGRNPQPWLSVYSAVKAGIIAFTHAMNRELGAEGIHSCALAPAFVDTPMTDMFAGTVSKQEMIRAEDCAEVVRTLLRLSPNCVIPEVLMARPGDAAV